MLSHADVQSFLSFVDPTGPVAAFFRRILPQDYARWIDVVAPYVTGALGLIRGVDRGRGVYISMSWFAPGVFVPTSV